MKRFLLLGFIFLWLASSLFSLDYYTNRTKEDKDKVNIYSPKKESNEDGWEFTGDKEYPKLYDNPKRAYWRLKIDAKELPYKYIEGAITDNFEMKHGEVTLTLKDASNNKLSSVNCKINGKVYPRPTGYYYEYNIIGKLMIRDTTYGIVSGKVSGKRIANRVNFTILSEIHRDNMKIGTFSGSFTLGINNSEGFKNGLLTFFVRLKEGKRWSYGRIRGRIFGNINDIRLKKATIIDVNGSPIGNIGGEFNLN